jgi:hypothetical protein
MWVSTFDRGAKVWRYQAFFISLFYYFLVIQVSYGAVIFRSCVALKEIEYDRTTNMQVCYTILHLSQDIPKLR